MITLKNVTKEFRLDNETTIAPVREVSLEVERGEFLMIVGRSGSGKTTLLNLCAGLIRPTSGQVLVDDKDIQTLDEKALSELRSKKVGFVFQSASMLPSLSVIENVAVPTMFSGSNNTEDNFKRAAEVLELVGLGERMHVLPKQLSGGEVRRVAIARALMNRPEILLADEPTSDLDVQTELKIVGALQRIHDSGVTILMVTHSLELVPYATRALKMEEGKLVPFEGTPAQALHVSLETASHSARRRPERSTSGWSSLLRKPVVVGFLGLGVALVAMTFAFGITLGKVGTDSTSVRPLYPGAPGPVLTGDGGMAMGAGEFQPTDFALYGTNGLYAGAMMGVPWPLKIDAAPGDAFKDPPLLENLSHTPGVFEGRLEAEKAEVKLGDTKANLMTYNGSYPGPMIRVKSGDTLKIDFVNSLPATTEKNILGYEKNHTNLHTHGLHVSPMEPADNVMLDIAPGQSYNYEYDLSKQEGGTLNFIHGHAHGLGAEQLWGGMLATILVEDETPVLSGYESHVMVLKDITLAGNEPQSHLFMSDYMYGKEGTIVTVNGQVNPVLSIKPGQVQRWQILNGSNARFYRIYLENHVLQLVGTDGGLLDKPYPVSTLLLSPGERVDVLVKASASTGSFKLFSLPYTRMTAMMGAGMSGMSMIGQAQNQAPGWWDAIMGTGSAIGMSTNVYSGMYPISCITWPVITDLLGMTSLEIQLQLVQGKSLLEIAQSRGITEDQLVKALLDQTEINFTQLVQARYLTQEQADGQLKSVQEFIGLMITANSSNYLYTGMDMYGGAYNYSMLNNALTNGGGAGGISGSMGSAATSDMGATGMCPGMVGTIGMGAYDMSSALQVTLMTLSCKGNVVSDSIPAVVNPDAQRLSLDLSSLPKRELTFGMDMGNGYMNGRDYDIEPLVITSKEGDYEIWHIVNQTGMDHPFHMHVNPFQVLAMMGGNLDYAWLYTTAPAWKDTVIVPKMGSVTLLVPVKDYTGMTMFHCHIVEHADIGMMGVWEIMEGMPGSD